MHISGHYRHRNSINKLSNKSHHRKNNDDVTQNIKYHPPDGQLQSPISKVHIVNLFNNGYVSTNSDSLPIGKNTQGTKSQRIQLVLVIYIPHDHIKVNILY